MKAQIPQLPQHKHDSYLLHRRQINLQIILPVMLSAILMAGLIVLISYATFNTGGDVARWAAVSTIWIIIPILLAGLITLALLVALIYGMSRLLGALPHYTGIAQNYIYIARTHIIEGAGKISGAVISVDGFLENIKVFFKRIVP